MAQALCGYANGPGGSGADLLALLGPTLQVDIGFDSKYRSHAGALPKAGITAVDALVDTGATESCIDNLLAAKLGLPVVDRRPISGAGGRITTSIYQAQIHVISLGNVIFGQFAGVDLIAGGQTHHALLGRTFLRNFRMLYDGKSGSVAIES